MTHLTLPLPLPPDLFRRLSVVSVAAGGVATAVVAALAMQHPSLFALIFADGIVPLVPGEAVLLSQVPEAQTAGWPAVLSLAAVAAAAAFLGDAVMYLLGRRFGTTRFAGQHPRMGRLLRRTGAELEDRGLPLIVSARLLPGWRVAVIFMAGATRFPWARFLPASAIGALLWATYLLVIGSTVGALTGGGPLLVAGLSLVTMLVLAWTIRRFRHLGWAT